MAEKVISWCLVVFGLMILVSPADGIQCREAVMAIWPCEPYLLGYGIVTFPCCFGAATLNQIANASQPDRKGICECLTQVGKAMEVQLEKAKQLPQLCQINSTIPIDDKVDCNKLG